MDGVEKGSAGTYLVDVVVAIVRAIVVVLIILQILRLYRSPLHLEARAATVVLALSLFVFTYHVNSCTSRLQMYLLSGL